MGQFTQATPSIEATASGDILRNLMFQTEIMQSTLFVMSKLAEMRGEVNKALGEAMQNVTENEADATRYSGIGSIVSGGGQVTFGGAGMIGEATIGRAQLNTVNDQLENVNEWDNAIKGDAADPLYGDVQMNPMGPRPVVVPDAQVSGLRNVNPKTAPVDEDVLNIAKGQSDPMNDRDPVEVLKKNVSSSRKSLEKEQNNIDSRRARFGEKMNMLSRITGDFGQGISQMQAEARGTTLQTLAAFARANEVRA
jgi:hypothetical protein